MTSVLADFNEVYDHDYVWTSVRRAPSFEVQALGPGEWVELYDHDGETCWGLVTERSGPIITCKIDWSTWRATTTTVPPLAATSRSDPTVTYSRPPA